MRLFLAIDLPLKIKEEVEKNLFNIKKEYADFSWVTLENYHLTLYFFGEVNNVDKIIKKLEETLFDKEQFYLYSNLVDLFIEHKITIYLNFLKEKKLEELGKAVVEKFAGQNYNNKKFIPHLTLARCRIPSKQQYFVLKKRLEKITVDVSFKVSRLVLFESILSGAKPVYKKIKVFKLL
jgi:2'-5' RNA ligase